MASAQANEASVPMMTYSPARWWAAVSKRRIDLAAIRKPTPAG